MGSKNFGKNRKVLPQGISMCNMKALSLLVQKLVPRLSFFHKQVKSQGQSHRDTIFGTNRKVLPQRICTCNMKAPSLLVKKLCQK